MPTINKISNAYRFFFYSFDCNEPEHVHVQREKMICKFWLKSIVLASNHGFSAKEIDKIRKLIKKQHNVIMEAWNEHCYQYTRH